MNQQLTDPEDFQVLRGIAKSCETTSWGLGQHLEAQGLRNRDSTPTTEAKTNGWAIAYKLDHGDIGWKWNREKVVELCKKSPPPSKGRKRA